MSEFRVPDAIEPFVGFKWLTVNPNGALWSTSAAAVAWPEDGSVGS